jgi:hypothetical protein
VTPKTTPTSTFSAFSALLPRDGVGISVADRLMLLPNLRHTYMYILGLNEAYEDGSS